VTVKREPRKQYSKLGEILSLVLLFLDINMTPENQLETVLRYAHSHGLTCEQVKRKSLL
jgi:hypothetical protein